MLIVVASLDTYDAFDRNSDKSEQAHVVRYAAPNAQYLRVDHSLPPAAPTEHARSELHRYAFKRPVVSCTSATPLTLARRVTARQASAPPCACCKIIEYLNRRLSGGSYGRQLYICENRAYSEK
ncbi:hypothetical protein ACJJTC_016936 [Scirpophaga incertulas]